MTILTIQEAQSNLADLIHRLSPSDEVIITENDRPVARLVATGEVAEKRQPILGGMPGSVLYVADDFDAPLDDLKDFME